MPSTNFIVAIWSPWHHIQLHLSSIVICLKITLILVLFPLWCLNKSISLSCHCHWVGLGWVGLGRVGSGRVGSGWVGSGWVGLGWVGSGWVGEFQLKCEYIYRNEVKIIADNIAYFLATLTILETKIAITCYLVIVSTWN